VGKSAQIGVDGFLHTFSHNIAAGVIKVKRNGKRVGFRE
jgi:hypothetical protein